MPRLLVLSSLRELDSLRRGEPRAESRSSPDLNDLAVAEPAEPAVSVIKPKAILRGGEGVQLHYPPVPACQRALYVELRALRQNFRKKFFRKCGPRKSALLW